MDIRVDYEGAEHYSAGEAVRKSFDKMNRKKLDNTLEDKDIGTIPEVSLFKRNGQLFAELTYDKPDGLTLDHLAFRDKTYRDIFVSGNLTPWGNFESGATGYTINAGSPVITDEDYHSTGHSLKCFGNTSSQIDYGRPNIGALYTYYTAAKFKVTRYVSGGGAGIFVDHPSTTVTTKTVGADFETVSIQKTTDKTYAPVHAIVGTISSADCDAYVDDFVFIDLTAVFGDNVPTKEQMDEMYDTYLSIVANSAIPSDPVEYPISTAHEYSPPVADCVNAFLQAMNKKAQKIGMENSSFSVPSGAGLNNTVTANDMLKMLVEACSYDELLKVWNKKSATISVGGEDARDVAISTTVANATLEGSYYIFGGKTGSWYTGTQSIRNFVCVGGTSDGKVLVGVILGATSDSGRFTAMKELFDIAVAKLNDPDYDTSSVSISTAASCAVCELPLYNTAMYQNYPLNILFAQNADALKVPASVTKVMSVITALDYLQNIKQKVKVDAADVQDGSGNYFSGGDVLSIEDLLYCMLLPSSNTCAMTLAREVGKIILNIG
jgi:D-alanyl-D-alanine carboxypeptidase